MNCCAVGDADILSVLCSTVSIWVSRRRPTWLPSQRQ